MGLFSFLFGNRPKSTVELVPDRIWLSQQARYNGIRQELEARSEAAPIATLLIAHFADTLEQLNDIVSGFRGTYPVTATLAETLSANRAAQLKLDETEIIDVIVAERHPLPSVDAQLIQFAETLPCRCRVVHYLSLEDPLLKLFAGEWVGQVLTKLGMTENEAIESPMVSRRVKAAQDKIQSQVYGDAKADSAAAWLEKNLPH